MMQSPKSLQKRNNKIVPFNVDKIEKAIIKAAGGNKDVIEKLKKDKEKILKYITSKLPENPDVEQVQDMVEHALMKMGHFDVAMAYIKFRIQKEAQRKKHPISDEIKQKFIENKALFKNDPIREFTYMRTYARWMENENRRETWNETVGRYCSFMQEKLKDKLSKEEYDAVYKAILNMEVMPSMRGLWSAGKSANASNVTFYNCTYITPETPSDLADILYILMCGAGVGLSVERTVVDKWPTVKAESIGKSSTFVIEDSKEGWADALKCCVENSLLLIKTPFDYSKIRKHGTLLKTSGGRSSGPLPLKELLEFTYKIISNRAGSKLHTIDLYDIVCKIAEVVVCGGSRRSSLLTLFDFDDPEMLKAKHGAFWETHPHRSMSNNSIVIKENAIADTDLIHVWDTLIKNKNGEPGFINRAGLLRNMPERRKTVLKEMSVAVDSIGVNPCCVTDDMWVSTTEGPRQVLQLIGTPFEAIINDDVYSCKTGFFENGVKPVYEVTTKRGYKFKATEEHLVLVKKNNEYEWKRVDNLTSQDFLCLNKNKNVSWDGYGTYEMGLLGGTIIGDGYISESTVGLGCWGSDKIDHFNLLNDCFQTLGFNKKIKGSSEDAQNKYDKMIFSSRALHSLVSTWGMNPNNKCITPQMESFSSEFHRGLIQGLFNTDGTVIGNQEKGISVRLSSVSVPLLETTQRILLRFGVASTIYKNRKLAGSKLLPNGNGGSAYYNTQAQHELVIAKENIIQFADRIGLSRTRKQDKLIGLISNFKRTPNIENFISQVTEVTLVGDERVYDCSVDIAHRFDCNGLVLHNCEIILNPKGMCNLSSVVATNKDNEQSLCEKAKIAAILGTFQATLTDFPYIQSKWKDNVELERLLGVSISGIFDNPYLSNPDNNKLLLKLKETVIKTNEEYSKKFGINQSTATTCVKPEGTSSIVSGVSSGIHPRFSPYYIRRIRISATDPLFKLMRDSGVPYHPEVGQSIENANLFVLEFPVKAPEGSKTAKDTTALEQLELWKAFKTNYTEHNPSMTCYIEKHEWVDVLHWLKTNWDIVGGLSFLPKTEHVYQLAPYEEITKEQYEKLLAEFPEIDYSKLMYYEVEDNTTGAKEYACTSGSCEL